MTGMVLGQSPLDPASMMSYSWFVLVCLHLVSSFVGVSGFDLVFCVVSLQVRLPAFSLRFDPVHLQDVVHHHS